MAPNMVEHIMQMRFVTFVLIVSCSALFLFVIIRWDRRTVSERQFDLKKSVEQKDIRSFRINYKAQGVNVTVSGREGRPKNWHRRDEKKFPPVVLFHDTRKETFSSKLWENLGTMRLITGLGHRVIAIDMPGFGKTRIKGSATHLTGYEFTESLVQHLKLRHCIFLVAGMSSSYVFPYLLDTPELAGQHVVALIAVATPQADAYNDQKFRNFKNIKTLYIQGDRDDVSNHIPLNRFKEVPDGEVQIVENAGYYVYNDQPKEFHRYVMRFLQHWVPPNSSL